VEIQYSLTQDDFFAFVRCLNARRNPQPTTKAANPPRTRPIFWIIIAVVFVPALIFFLVRGGGQGGGRGIEWSPGLAAVCTFWGLFGLLVLAGWLSRRTLPKRLYEAAKAKGAVHDLTVLISPERLTASTGLSTTIMDWSLVEHVGQTDEHIFICTDASAGFTIPKRAFNSNADAIMFLETAERYWNARRAR